MKTEPIAEAAEPRASALPRRYFIADAHLDGSDTPRAQKFRAFLERISKERAGGPVELYILGDLFEFWYEYRAALFDVYRADLAALEKSAKAGVALFFLSGNRDFAYGDYVRRRFGARLLGDGGAVVLNDSRPVWLEHGDLLCTSDTRYLRFRRIVRSGPVRLLFWLMPWSCARSMIDRVRKKTSADKQRKPAAALEIDRAAARRRLEAVRCPLLLCGHTHRPLSEDLGAGYRLIVLPPWCEQSAGFVDDGSAFRPFEFEVKSKK